eukprot:CAMPEP_0203754552 /NCGR_PEP_ID=MMETSP0098-20131031/8139_1 /ASSEMBLY_ACC=CAM_ASM_000208 /TAXON_ID=96639 /ORGANISM=" , Strain NY0313808BC1" /LENGTH=344 /DNA_ID=CAMNT_0050645627 /DNA_START=265 /DNA_END=1299 /DNA_ORIENTATION=-
MKLKVCQDEEERMNLLLDAHVAKREIKEILKFWAVFALLTLYEYYIELFLFWIPFYYTVKFALLAWILAPRSNGAAAIFDKILAPQFEVMQRWLETYATPVVQDVTKNLLKGLTSLFVATCVGILSEEQAKHVQEHLKDLVEHIDNSMPQGTPEGDSHMSAGQVETKESKYREDFVPDEQEPVTPSYSMFREYVGSYFSYSGPAETPETAAETKETDVHEESKSSPSLERSDSWVYNAFEGVVGLTVSTKQVLMGDTGRSASFKKLKQRTSDEGSACSQEDNVDISKQGRGAYSKYDNGFEHLSDYDDSDNGSSPLKTSESRKARAPAPDPLRRRRPVTRSQIK